MNKKKVITAEAQIASLSAEENAILATITSERAKYGRWMTLDECVNLCNDVAWAHRAGGWGLSTKNGGTRGSRYDGAQCATDILHNRNTNNHYDILGAAGEASTPMFGNLGPMTDPNRPWMAPIEPRGSGTGNPGGGGGGGGTTPTPNYTQALTDILNEVRAARAELSATRVELSQAKQQLNDATVFLQDRIQAVENVAADNGRKVDVANGTLEKVRQHQNTGTHRVRF